MDVGFYDGEEESREEKEAAEEGTSGHASHISIEESFEWSVPMRLVSEIPIASQPRNDIIIYVSIILQQSLKNERPHNAWTTSSKLPNQLLALL